MTTKEDVLLQIGEVRYKKGDGTLYVMKERLAWMADNRDKVAVAHRYADIKMQKISPEGKPKVQLQLVLHDGNNSTFHFVNRNGQQAMLADRDKVKELLQQLLPKFHRKVDKHLEEKAKLLSKFPQLYRLYRDLVVTKVITSDEFWATHAKQYKDKTLKGKQDIGVSGAFLADIKPQTNGCNGLKYNLTYDIIKCIFKTYPIVKRKHRENVPNKMTEAEFWTKFFQSHYFHRDRIVGGGQKDIFAECGKIDDQLFKSEIENCVDDPLLNLREFEDVPLDEGYGGVELQTNAGNNANIVHQNIIKRFNQHSIMVLKTTSDIKEQKNPEKTTETEKDADADADGEYNVPAKKQKILEKISYDDLGPLALDDKMNENAANKRKRLQVSYPERYFYGPLSTTGTEVHEDAVTLENVQSKLVELTETWKHTSKPKIVLDSTAAVNALGELSPGGALMRSFKEESCGQFIAPHIETEMRNILLSLSELLKQFWKCNPFKNVEEEKKYPQVYESIQRFKEARLEPFDTRIFVESGPLRVTLMHHFNNLLHAVTQKYMKWKNLKMGRKHKK